MVSWSSSNTAVATVTGDGRVRAIAAGQATISAYASVRLDTYYATSRGQATVTVTSPVP